MRTTRGRVRASALVILSTALVLAAVGCGGGGDSTSADSTSGTTPSEGGSGEETHKIGVVLPSLSTLYWKAVADGTEEQAAKMPGVELDVHGESSTTGVDETSAMVSTINDMVTKGTEALIVADGFPQFTPTLQRAMSQGIPVVFVDANIGELTPSEVTTVATEPVAAGEKAGKFILEQLNGKGEVGLLAGIPGIKASLDRTNSAKSVLEEGGVKVASELPTECDRVKGLNATKDMLTAHPNIDLIYGACGPPMIGAIQAVKQLGLSDQVQLVGFDADSEQIAAIKAGTMLGSVAQFPKKEGSIAVEKAVEALETEQVPAGVDSGSEIVTKENVDSVESY